MRILVTGSRGFVGRWLMQHLTESGDDAVELDGELDIVDDGKTRSAVVSLRPDAIIHLAGYADVGESWKEPRRCFDVNAMGTLSVLAAANSLDKKPRVLVISSAEVYGKVTPEQLPIVETAPIRPLSPYASSKAAAELIATQYWLGYELPVICARAFNHIGPGQNPQFAVAAFAQRITEAIASGNNEIVVGDLSSRRDFTDVRDVVRAYRMLIEKGQPGETYNVCSGEDVAIGDIVEKLIKLADADLYTRVNPELVRIADVPVTRGDNTKLTSTTGWNRSISLEDSLKDVLDYSTKIANR